MLFIDVESTGLTKEHGLTQIAGIIDINGKIVDEFNFHIKPFENDLICDKALEITGLTREDLETFEDPIIVKNKLFKIFDKHVKKFDKKDKMILAGHNLRVFDFNMLLTFFEKCGEKYFGSYVDYKRKFDTLALLENMQVLNILDRAPSNKLEPICEYYGIKLENAHDALCDIRANRELAYKLARILKK